MKTTRYEHDATQSDAQQTDCPIYVPDTIKEEQETEVVFQTVNMSKIKESRENLEAKKHTAEPIKEVEESFADELVRRIELYSMERWSDTASQVSLQGQTEDVETIASDTEPVPVQCEPTSEMYYTASSEVSLLSDFEAATDKLHVDNEESVENKEKKECVIAGHVAAMRERFENMTRANTPCPDLGRSLSPSLEAIRNVTPSPDRLG